LSEVDSALTVPKDKTKDGDVVKAPNNGAFVSRRAKIETQWGGRYGLQEQTLKASNHATFEDVRQGNALEKSNDGCRWG
jgi:hypothetical protein